MASGEGRPINLVRGWESGNEKKKGFANTLGKPPDGSPGALGVIRAIREKSAVCFLRVNCYKSSTPLGIPLKSICG